MLLASVGRESGDGQQTARRRTIVLRPITLVTLWTDPSCTSLPLGQIPLPLPRYRPLPAATGRYRPHPPAPSSARPACSATFRSPAALSRLPRCKALAAIAAVYATRARGERTRRPTAPLGEPRGLVLQPWPFVSGWPSRNLATYTVHAVDHGPSLSSLRAAFAAVQAALGLALEHRYLNSAMLLEGIAYTEDSRPAKQVTAAGPGALGGHRRPRSHLRLRAAFGRLCRRAICSVRHGHRRRRGQHRFGHCRTPDPPPLRRGRAWIRPARRPFAQERWRRVGCIHVTQVAELDASKPQSLPMAASVQVRVKGACRRIVAAP